MPAYAEQLGLLMGYYRGTRVLHRYARCSLDTAMSATPNTKSLQPVCDADADAVVRLCRASYYKYRAATLMFGFNTGITGRIGQFCELNALRKNQLLAFYPELHATFSQTSGARRAATKCAARMVSTARCRRPR